jgi:hypothetical protein
MKRGLSTTGPVPFICYIWGINTYPVKPFFCALTATVPYSLYEYGRCSWETRPVQVYHKIHTEEKPVLSSSSLSQVLGKWKKCGGLEAVAHAFNLSNLGGGGWRFVVWGHSWQRVSKTPYELISQVSPQVYPAVTLVLWLASIERLCSRPPWAKTETECDKNV